MPTPSTDIDLALAAELGQQLRVDSVRASTSAGSGHPTSSMSAADLMAVLVSRHLRYDWDNPDYAGQRPPHLLQGACFSPAVLALQGGRSRLRRGTDDRVPPLRIAAGRPSDPGAAVGGRGDRLARAGPAGRRWRRAGRQVPGRGALPGLGPVRRQRDGRRVDVGGSRQGLALQAGQPHRHRRRQPPRPERPHRAFLGPGCLPPPGRGVRGQGVRHRRPRRRRDRPGHRRRRATSAANSRPSS